jgi:DNA-binding response OmpR family regulator
VHVKNLRAKLGPHAGELETIRGVGYRWRLAE